MKLSVIIWCDLAVMREKHDTYTYSLSLYIYIYIYIERERERYCDVAVWICQLVWEQNAPCSGR